VRSPASSAPQASDAVREERHARAQSHGMRPTPATTTRATDRRVDQQTQDRKGRCTLNSLTDRLIRLDRLRTSTSPSPALQNGG
jgi:uncharacterized protein YjiS (DUF1127 family)